MSILTSIVWIGPIPWVMRAGFPGGRGEVA